VPEFIEDLTSVEELHKLKVRETVFYTREKGSGRPTKRKGRMLNKVIGA